MNRFVGLMSFALFAACSGSTALDDLNYDAKSTVATTAPITVQTVVTVRNFSDEAVEIQGNVCPAGILAFDNPAREGPPVWTSVPAGSACTAQSILITLAPGDYYEFRFSGTVPSTLPAGRYYLSSNLYGRNIPAGQFVK